MAVAYTNVSTIQQTSILQSSSVKGGASGQLCETPKMKRLYLSSLLPKEPVEIRFENITYVVSEGFKGNNKSHKCYSYNLSAFSFDVISFFLCTNCSYFYNN